jgi:hypothetical protein
MLTNKLLFKIIPSAVLMVVCPIILSAFNLKPSVYIDCPNMFCDILYLKQEISFVDYMQNRQEADIYILATNAETGGQGQQVQLVFIGQHVYEGNKDTIQYFTDPNATMAIKREQFVQYIKKGLLPFLMESPLQNLLNYSVDLDSLSSEETDTLSPHDPWNNWVFNVRGSGNFDGEKRFKNLQLYGNINALMVTDKQKFVCYTGYGYEESSFTLSDGESFKGIKWSYDVYSEYVKSLGQHFSVGAIGELGSSTFGNTDIFARLRPAVEYNFYPYNLVQTKRFSILYAVGPAYYNYTDSTIYDKLEELLWKQGLKLEFNKTEKWGNVYIELGFDQFLHNLKFFNAYLNPSLNIQIVKGLSLNFGAYLSYVSDRINIAKSDITDEDILLQIKQLDTDFTYFGYFGLNYRFGSKYNNYVNQRF